MFEHKSTDTRARALELYRADIDERLVINFDTLPLLHVLRAFSQSYFFLFPSPFVRQIRFLTMIKDVRLVPEKWKRKKDEKVYIVGFFFIEIFLDD